VSKFSNGFSVQFATNEKSDYYFMRICPGDTSEGYLFKVKKSEMKEIMNKQAKIELVNDIFSKYAWKRFKLVNDLEQVSLSNVSCGLESFGKRAEFEDAILNQVWSLDFQKK
jgi:hypothetical protein